jgi:hypothetical protein
MWSVVLKARCRYLHVRGDAVAAGHLHGRGLLNEFTTAIYDTFSLQLPTWLSEWRSWLFKDGSAGVSAGGISYLPFSRSALPWVRVNKSGFPSSRKTESIRTTRRKKPRRRAALSLDNMRLKVKPVWMISREYVGEPPQQSLKQVLCSVRRIVVAV